MDPETSPDQERITQTTEEANKIQAVIDNFTEEQTLSEAEKDLVKQIINEVAKKTKKNGNDPIERLENITNGEIQKKLDQKQEREKRYNEQQRSASKEGGPQLKEHEGDPEENVLEKLHQREVEARKARRRDQKKLSSLGDEAEQREEISGETKGLEETQEKAEEVASNDQTKSLISSAAEAARKQGQNAKEFLDRAAETVAKPFKAIGNLIDAGRTKIKESDEGFRPRKSLVEISEKYGLDIVTDFIAETQENDRDLIYQDQQEEASPIAGETYVGEKKEFEKQREEMRKIDEAEKVEAPNLSELSNEELEILEEVISDFNQDNRAEIYNRIFENTSLSARQIDLFLSNIKEEYRRKEDPSEEAKVLGEEIGERTEKLDRKRLENMLDEVYSGNPGSWEPNPEAETIEKLRQQVKDKIEKIKAVLKERGFDKPNEINSLIDQLKKLKEEGHERFIDSDKTPYELDQIINVLENMKSGEISLENPTTLKSLTDKYKKDELTDKIESDSSPGAPEAWSPLTEEELEVKEATKQELIDQAKKERGKVERAIKDSDSLGEMTENLKNLRDNEEGYEYILGSDQEQLYSMETVISGLKEDVSKKSPLVKSITNNYNLREQVQNLIKKGETPEDLSGEEADKEIGKLLREAGIDIDDLNLDEMEDRAELKGLEQKIKQKMQEFEQSTRQGERDELEEAIGKIEDRIREISRTEQETTPNEEATKIDEELGERVPEEEMRNIEQARRNRGKMERALKGGGDFGSVENLDDLIGNLQEVDADFLLRENQEEVVPKSDIIETLETIQKGGITEGIGIKIFENLFDYGIEGGLKEEITELIHKSAPEVTKTNTQKGELEFDWDDQGFLNSFRKNTQAVVGAAIVALGFSTAAPNFLNKTKEPQEDVKVAAAEKPTSDDARKKENTTDEGEKQNKKDEAERTEQRSDETEESVKPRDRSNTKNKEEKPGHEITEEDIADTKRKIENYIIEPSKEEFKWIEDYKDDKELLKSITKLALIAEAGSRSGNVFLENDFQRALEDASEQEEREGKIKVFTERLSDNLSQVSDSVNKDKLEQKAEEEAEKLVEKI